MSRDTRITGLPRFTRVDAPPPFELCFAELGAEPDEVELAVLSAHERQRAERFVFPRDSRRFRAAHVALRLALAERIGVNAGAIRFVEGPFGKPAIEGEPACAFNLTHSGDVALIALADGAEIGVDAEVMRVVDDATALARRHFTTAECAQLEHAAESQRDLVFLRCWTRKEACLKAIGSGLSIAPETFEAGADGASRQVRIEMPQGVAAVEVHTLETMPGIVAAIARWVPPAPA